MLTPVTTGNIVRMNLNNDCVKSGDSVVDGGRAIGSRGLTVILPAPRKIEFISEVLKYTGMTPKFQLFSIVYKKI